MVIILEETMKKIADGVILVCSEHGEFVIPNVEVTGATRLYRVASVWTAGLARPASTSSDSIRAPKLIL